MGVNRFWLDFTSKYRQNYGSYGENEIKNEFSMQNTIEIGIFIFFPVKKCISVVLFKNLLFFQKKSKFQKKLQHFFQIFEKNFKIFFFKISKKKIF